MNRTDSQLIRLHSTVLALLLGTLCGCGGAEFTAIDEALVQGDAGAEAAVATRIVEPDGPDAVRADGGVATEEAGDRDAGGGSSSSSSSSSGSGSWSGSGSSASGSSASSSRRGGGSSSSSSCGGSSSSSSSGMSSSGGNKGVCCRFTLSAGTQVMACSGSAPWLCTGAQTYSCAQAGDCAVGASCYVSGGPYGGVVVDCP